MGRAGRSLALLVVALLVVGARAGWFSKKKEPPAPQPEQKHPVIEYLEAQGGQASFKLGRACPTCPRGAIATKDLEAGELIARVPFSAAVAFPPALSTDAAARAYELLVRMHTDPSFNATYAAWWASQPGPDSVLVPESLSQEQLSMLQSSWLSGHFTGMREMARGYFEGRRGKDKVALNQALRVALSGSEAVPAADEERVSFDTFLYICSLVVTRAFDFPVAVGGAQENHAFMMPALDILNHADPGKENSRRTSDDTAAYSHALRPIRKGEEITHPYHPGLTHRPDVAFAIYGFVPKHDPPLLCAQDLPDFQRTSPWRQTAYTDSEYDPPTSAGAAQEIKRLQGVLADLPTTLEQDEAAMEQLAAGDWQLRTVYELRVERKRALRHRIAHLQELLERLLMNEAESQAEL